LKNIVHGINEFNNRSGRSSLGNPGSFMLDKGEEKMFNTFIKNRKSVWSILSTHTFSANKYLGENAALGTLWKNV